MRFTDFDTFALCRYEENMDHEVDSRACDTKEEEERGSVDKMPVFGQQPMRDYGAASSAVAEQYAAHKGTVAKD